MGCGSSTGVRLIEQKDSFYSRYKLFEKLGEGGFGQVRACKARHNSNDYAVKILDIRQATRRELASSYAEVDRSLLHAVLSELKVWKQLGDCENTVRLLEYFQDRGLVYIVMERCVCSLMDRILIEDLSVTQIGLAGWLRQMLLGIRHCHSSQVVHRDVKPDNFLCGGPDGQTLKLADFGLSVPLPKTGKLKGIYGTTPFMSPEMLLNTGYREGTDLWSFGSSAYLMLYGTFPYMAPEEVPKEQLRAVIKEVIKAGKPEPAFEPIAEEIDGQKRVGLRAATNFVKELLNRNPDVRPSAQEALGHPYLNSQVNLQLSDDESAGEDLEIGPRLRAATLQTVEFKKTMDETAQKTLDKTITKIVQQLGKSDEVRTMQDKVPGKSRCNTHSGVLRRDKGTGSAPLRNWKPVLPALPNQVDEDGGPSRKAF